MEGAPGRCHLRVQAPSLETLFLESPCGVLGITSVSGLSLKQVGFRETLPRPPTPHPQRGAAGYGGAGGRVCIGSKLALSKEPYEQSLELRACEGEGKVDRRPLSPRPALQ